MQLESGHAKSAKIFLPDFLDKNYEAREGEFIGTHTNLNKIENYLSSIFSLQSV